MGDALAITKDEFVVEIRERQKRRQEAELPQSCEAIQLSKSELASVSSKAQSSKTTWLGS